MAKHDIATINEDVDENCNVCSVVRSTANRTRWQCPFFDEVRRGHDPEPAKVATKYLLACIQCRIAPAMKIDGSKTYWGGSFDDSTDEKKKVVLGKDEKLRKSGKHA